MVTQFLNRGPLFWLGLRDKRGRTPVHVAIIEGHFNLALWLLRQAPKMADVQDARGKRPLDRVSHNATSRDFVAKYLRIYSPLQIDQLTLLIKSQSKERFVDQLGAAVRTGIEYAELRRRPRGDNFVELAVRGGKSDWIRYFLPLGGSFSLMAGSPAYLRFLLQEHQKAVEALRKKKVEAREVEQWSKAIDARDSTWGDMAHRKGFPAPSEFPERDGFRSLAGSLGEDRPLFFGFCSLLLSDARGGVKELLELRGRPRDIAFLRVAWPETNLANYLAEEVNVMIFFKNLPQLFFAHNGPLHPSVSLFTRGAIENLLTGKQSESCDNLKLIVQLLPFLADTNLAGDVFRHCQRLDRNLPVTAILLQTLGETVYLRKATVKLVQQWIICIQRWNKLSNHSLRDSKHAAPIAALCQPNQYKVGLLKWALKNGGDAELKSYLFAAPLLLTLAQQYREATTKNEKRLCRDLLAFISRYVAIDKMKVKIQDNNFVRVALVESGIAVIDSSASFSSQPWLFAELNQLVYGSEVGGLDALTTILSSPQKFLSPVELRKISTSLFLSCFIRRILLLPTKGEIFKHLERLPQIQSNFPKAFEGIRNTPIDQLLPSEGWQIANEEGFREGLDALVKRGIVNSSPTIAATAFFRGWKESPQTFAWWAEHYVHRLPCRERGELYSTAQRTELQRVNARALKQFRLIDHCPYHVEWSGTTRVQVMVQNEVLERGYYSINGIESVIKGHLKRRSLIKEWYAESDREFRATEKQKPVQRVHARSVSKSLKALTKAFPTLTLSPYGRAVAEESDCLVYDLEGKQSKLHYRRLGITIEFKGIPTPEELDSSRRSMEESLRRRIQPCSRTP